MRRAPRPAPTAIPAIAPVERPLEVFKGYRKENSCVVITSVARGLRALAVRGAVKGIGGVV